MNARKVKFFTIIFVSLLAWSLPACSDDDNITGNGKGDVTGTPDATDNDATTEPDATEGDATEGDVTEGDATEGDATEGDATEGDATEGDATEGDATEGDATEGDATEGDATGGMTGCDFEGFDAVAQDAFYAFGAFGYAAQNTLGAPVDAIELILPQDAAPGTLTFDDSGYFDCDNCLVIRAGCDEDLANCETRYFANEGTIEIDSIGESGTTFAGRIRNARLIEATMEEDGDLLRLENGQNWCLSDYAFSTTIQ